MMSDLFDPAGMESTEEWLAPGAMVRLRYHGVMPLKDGLHPVVGRHRINLTLRRAA